MTLMQCKQELLDFLEKPLQSDLKAVVLPDFFMDRIITLPWMQRKFSEKLQQVAQRKGGSIDGIPQTDMTGGNAINVTSALTNLGAFVTPIICTSAYGLEQIKYNFRNRLIDYSHVKTLGEASVTTALEFRQETGKSNVMIRDLGALAYFSPRDFNESDYKLITDADYVCVFNWAGTLRHGTELAKTVFRHAKQTGKTRTYYDTADPTPNIKGINDLIENVLKTPQVDIFSCNENEAVTYANHIDPNFREHTKTLNFADSALEAARILAHHFSARIDLHTTDFSATIKGSNEVVVPAFKVRVLRATGAGDAWCSGNIYADYHDLPDKCRLTLANALAACYLSNADGLHPTKEVLRQFLEAQDD
jgi:sugar/nucleoside kinase (ribokinase family)